MPLILPVELTDTFEQWRQKTNTVIDTCNDIINNEAIADAITLIPPINDQDILLYSAEDSVFYNHSLELTLDTWANNNNIKPTSLVKNYYMATHINIL